MKITFKQCQTVSAILVALSLSACARFETRMQANGNFDYQQAELIEPYQTGDFTNDEARDQYDIPALTEQQQALGLQGSDVDVRPPVQLLSVIDGVLLDKSNSERTKVWFNAFTQGDDIQVRVWSLIESYLAENNVDIISQDATHLETGIFAEHNTFGNVLNRNVVTRESSYHISLETQSSGQRAAIIVDALSYAEVNEEKALTLKLAGSTKQDIELRFVNKLLEYAYQVRQSEQLAAADTQPLAIKLGFDDNHQSAWIVDSEFEETWRKLPDLFTLLNFKLVDHDKNLGYFLLDYIAPNDAYWAENNLNPFTLPRGEYFIQLGEAVDGTTTLVWLDDDKKPLSDEKVTEMYLSITEYVREALIEKEKQTKEF